MHATATPSQPSAPVWQELGRPSPCGAQDWATWVSPLGDGGDALYRSLVLADGNIAVTIELHSPHGSGPRTVHRGRCGMPPDPGEAAERVRLLLGAADRAASRAVETRRGEEDVAAGHGRPSPPRLPDDASRDERRGGVSAAARYECEDRIREHARGEAAATA